MKVALSPEVADGQAQYAEAVQLAQDVLLEGEQRGQRVQLGVQPLAVTLARVAFCHAVLGWWFNAGRKW